MILNEYISKQVGEIMDSKEFQFPLNLAMSAAWICGNFKAVNLKVLDLTEMSSLADYFVIATSTNTTQARSIAEEISGQLKNHGSKIVSKEGLQETDWILLDLGDIIVHVFQEMSRSIYDLDNLWSKAPRIDIPNDYYISDNESGPASKNKNDRDFF